MVDKNGRAVNDAYVFKTSCLTLKQCLKIKFANIPERLADAAKNTGPGRKALIEKNNKIKFNILLY